MLRRSVSHTAIGDGLRDLVIPSGLESIARLSRPPRLNDFPENTLYVIVFERSLENRGNRSFAGCWNPQVSCRYVGRRMDDGDQRARPADTLPARHRYSLDGEIREVVSRLQLATFTIDHVII